MKLAALLLSLVWLPACTFPDYDTSPSTPTTGGSGTIVGPSQGCGSDIDCDAGACVDGLCRGPGCDDGLPNGSETDVDCGGNCDPCGVGRACKSTEDCDAVACSQGKCQPAACNDAVLNQDEADLDCGGSCSVACDAGQRCDVAADCKSGICRNSKKCAAASCTDDVRNGDEPTVDCGGSCPAKCAADDPCNESTDCASTSCENQRCLPLAPTGQQISRLNWTATASDTAGNSFTGEALDGNANSFWTTGNFQTPAMWFELDMQTEQSFFSIEIDCIRQADDFPDAMNIQLSADGTYSGDPANPNYAIKTGTTVISFRTPQLARYIRFTLTQGKSKWWNIDELRVKQ